MRRQQREIASHRRAAEESEFHPALTCRGGCEKGGGKAVARVDGEERTAGLVIRETLGCAKLLECKVE